MKTSRIAIFATGKGSNAEKIVRHFEGNKYVRISLICTNKKNSGAIDIGGKYGIPVHVFSKADLYESDVILNRLQQDQVTHIVLAGFLWLLPSNLIQAYHNRIVNIHPALLPKFGGKGMYGIHVHEAVKKSGEKETGITIHLVNEKYDEGELLAQEKIILTGQETPGEIALKVQVLEHQHYPKVIEDWLKTRF